MNTEKEISYIYSYIKYIYFSVKEFENDKFLLDISRRIKNSMPNSNFSSGKLNFAINNYVFKEMKSRNSKSFKSYEELRNHMYLLIEYCKRVNPKSIENTEYVMVEIMKYALENFDYSDIISGICDEKLENLIFNGIESTFKPLESISNVSLNISNIACKDGTIIDDRFFVTEYVYQYLLKNKNIFDFNGDLKYLADLISSDIYMSSINYEDVLSHKKDDVIDSFIRTRKNGIKLKDSFLMMESEVSKYVLANNTYMDIGNQDENISREIFKLSKYLLENRYTREDVISGKCNAIMENHMRTDCIMQNSKVCTQKLKGTKQSPNKFFLNAKSVVQSSKFRAAVLIATVSIIGTSTIVNKIDTKKAEEAYEIFDTYEYKTSTAMSEEFADNINHVLNYYNEYGKYGEEYTQICLYKAFASIQKNPFSTMDVMCSIIKERTRYSSDLSQLYDSLIVHPSYLDYVYNRLLEVDNSYSKYKTAVSKYNAQVANYKELEPFSVLESKDSESAKMIMRMMKDYGKYIEDLELKMGKAIREEKVR